MATSHQRLKPQPHRRLTVTTAATSRLLTSLAAVKQSLGITDTEQDTLINALIGRVSDEIVSYLNVKTPDDGAVQTIGRETYVETIRNQPSEYGLFLSRRPLSSVTSLVEDTVTLTEGTHFQVNAGTGMLDRLSSDSITTWSFDKLVVTYVAGYLLPDDENSNLPADIEEAAIYTVSSRMSDLDTGAGDREIRSESLDGVFSASYETTGAKRYSAHQGLPQRAVALLAKYRIPMI